MIDNFSGINTEGRGWGGGGGGGGGRDIMVRGEKESQGSTPVYYEACLKT